jgi:hypothetical protein
MWDEEDEGRARVSLTDHDMTIAGKCLPLHKDLPTFSNYLTETCPLSWDLTGSMKFRCITRLKVKESLSAQKSLQFCDAEKICMPTNMLPKKNCKIQTGCLNMLFTIEYDRF